MRSAKPSDRSLAGASTPGQGVTASTGFVEIAKFQATARMSSVTEAALTLYKRGFALTSLEIIEI
jgi:hypothetical protein